VLWACVWICQDETMRCSGRSAQANARRSSHKCREDRQHSPPGLSAEGDCTENCPPPTRRSCLACSLVPHHGFVGTPELDFGQFSSSSGGWNAEHRIVLEDVVGTLEHEFHAAEVAEGAPATMDVGPIKQLEAIRIGDGAQPGDGI